MKMIINKSVLVNIELKNKDDIDHFYAVILLAEQQLKKQHSLDKKTIKINGFVADKEKIKNMIDELLELNGI